MNKHTQIPVFIVSLKRDTERREIISDVLNQLDVNFQFIDAVDGKLLSAEDLASIHIPEEKAGASLGEIACSLSHQLVYQCMVDHSLPWAVILEDDAIIDERFKDLVDSLSVGEVKKFNSDHVYILGGQEGLSSRKRISLSFFNRFNIGKACFRKLIYKPSKIFRTCCYIVSRPMSEKLITEFSRGFYFADSWCPLHKKKIIKGYYLTEIIGHPLATAENSHLERYRLERQAEEDSVVQRREKSKVESTVAFAFLQVRRFLRSCRYN